LVALAQQEDIRVVPLIGPSSLLLALMASGLNGQRFAFHGYLPPRKPNERKLCATLKANPASGKQTQTLHRNALPQPGHVRCDPAGLLTHGTRLTVATDLTLPGESVVTRTIASNGKRKRRPKSSGVRRFSCYWPDYQRSVDAQCAFGKPLPKAVDRTCAKALGKALGDIVLDRVIENLFSLDYVARHGVNTAEVICQTQLDALSPGPHQSGEHFGRFLETSPAPSFYHIDELLMNVVQQQLCVRLVFGAWGENGSRNPLFSPAVSKRRSTPSLSIVPVNPKPSISTPIEPTILALLT
jgi:hypothetical protein